MNAQVIQIVGIVDDAEQARNILAIFLVDGFVAGRFYPADPLHYPGKIVVQMFFQPGCSLEYQDGAREVLIPNHLLKAYKQPLSRDNGLG